MFLHLGNNRKKFKHLKNIIPLGCPIKNVQNTKMQFKKKYIFPNKWAEYLGQVKVKLMEIRNDS